MWPATSLIARSIAHDLEGELTYDWQASGLVATLRLRKDKLAA